MLDADRQFDGDDAKAVAEIDVAGRAQVDRHHRPAFDARGPVAAVFEIAPHGAGDAGEEDVVDRGAERLADGLDLRQRDRLAPCDPLRSAWLALEAGLRIALHQQEIAEFLGDARAVADEARRAQRIAGDVEGGGKRRFETLRARIDGGDDGGHDALQPALLLVLGGGRGGGCSGPSTSFIVTSMSAIPSAMAWCMRKITAAPPSYFSMV